MRTLFARWVAGAWGGTMKPILRFAAAASLALALTPFAAPQSRPLHQTPIEGETTEDKLAIAKNQQEDLLKADHLKNLRDARHLIELAEELKQELEKNDRHVLSLSSLKQTEEIEKLAKRIRSRLVR